MTTAIIEPPKTNPLRPPIRAAKPSPLSKIKNTMCHHTLKCVVCAGTRVLDAQGTTPH